jgi:Fe-S-cluster-containing dehydrogenase component/CRP-like cAMP-binding protein
MLRKEATTKRPGRWDMPLDDTMSNAEVDRLLKISPFVHMDPAKFPEACSLRGILQNDTRVVAFAQGDLVVREGEYGHSAFMLLSGTVRVTLDSLPPEILGVPKRRRGFPWRKLLRFCFPSQYAEVRRQAIDLPGQLGARGQGAGTHLFLQDVPGVLDRFRTLTLGPGEIFGELAALSRSPRTATVFADQDARLLEIRWQGLRDLMRFDGSLRSHVQELYRRNSLATHLRETSVLRHLSSSQIQDLVAATQFESFGEFEWNRPFKSLAEATPNDRIASEPLIASEGNLANGLVIVRNGFARLSQRYGHGHRTCSYLGKGDLFGLQELWHQSQTGRNVQLRHSLRAVGYVDILRIPTELVESHVFANLPATLPDELTIPIEEGTPSTPSPLFGAASCATTADAEPACDVTTGRLRSGMLEFLVDQRLINGTQTMIISLDRCTRCDDCVRACAATHDNNPRFVRSGPTFGHQMFASACMHCEDPVCMIGCPTGAIRRDTNSGSVTINDGTCIGCGTCASSCPYQAIRMVEIVDQHGRPIIDQSARMAIQKATKCDLCVDVWGGPACQRACPHDALVRIDLRRPDALEQWLSR